MNDEELRRNIERWEKNIEKGRTKRLYLKRY